MSFEIGTLVVGKETYLPEIYVGKIVEVFPKRLKYKKRFKVQIFSVKPEPGYCLIFEEVELQYLQPPDASDVHKILVRLVVGLTDEILKLEERIANSAKQSS